MSGDPENLTLVFLRRLDAKMDRLIEDNQGVKTRLSLLETGLANVRTETAGLHHAYATIPAEMDRFNTCLDRIERRLDLQDAHQ